MKIASFRALGAALLLTGALSATANAATQTQVLSAGVYTQNFNTISSGTTWEDSNGWILYNDATSTSLGGALSQQPIGPVRAWNHGTGQFKNVSSANIPSTSDAAAQSANTNRAVGLRQLPTSNGYADPGASFNFNFSTTGLNFQSFSLDLLMLDVQSRSNTYDIQYGIGANPTSFTTLGSWADPGVFGSTTFTFDRDDFGASLDNQSQAWIRIVALNASTGTGSTNDMVGLDNFSATTTAAAVPEPSTYALGLIGAAATFLARRRFRRA
jgi:hypothetical protein